MSLHLAEISEAVAPGAHAVVLLDQAGWHLSKRLVIPDNVTLVPLPAKAPELNPVENVWQFMRENWLLEPGVHVLPRHPRPLLRRLEQADRPALAHHVPRIARLGTQVLISRTWYKRLNVFPVPRRRMLLLNQFRAEPSICVAHDQALCSTAVRHCRAAPLVTLAQAAAFAHGTDSERITTWLRPRLERIQS
jgi:hypothetical protein